MEGATVGDLVMMKIHPKGGLKRTGVIIDIVQKKCWRSEKLGNKVNWGLIEPEPHAIVMFDHTTQTMPITNLKVIE